VVARPIVFDLDLTLIHSRVHSSWLEVLVARGLDSNAAERAYLAGTGFASVETARAAFPTLARAAQLAVVAEFNEAVVAARSEEIAGASETLSALRAAGHPLFLSTGADPDTLHAALRTSPLGGCI
jgi:phosphoserine phosphatase